MVIDAGLDGLRRAWVQERKQNTTSCICRTAYFQKNREHKSSESEKWSQKRLDGKYDGYMKGLDGAEKRKC